MIARLGHLLPQDAGSEVLDQSQARGRLDCFFCPAAPLLKKTIHPFAAKLNTLPLLHFAIL